MMLTSYVIVGFISGIVSGALGIGGGTVMVPLFVLLFGLTQHQAQGTALAVMLAPVFLLAVWRYYTAGHINVSMAVFTACGFLAGALVGAHFVQGVPDAILKRMFGAFLVLIGVKFLLMK